jgi:hypothetical protein
MVSGFAAAARGTCVAVTLAALALLWWPAAAPAQQSQEQSQGGQAAQPVPEQAQGGQAGQPVPGQKLPNGLTIPPSQTKPPPGWRLTPQQAAQIAISDPKVQADLHGDYQAAAWLSGPRRWQISLFSGTREEAQITVDDRTGKVVKALTGDQVGFFAARGEEGAYGRKLNAPYVWIPLMVLFILPFIDPRRPFRLLHFDLLALLSFSVSYYFLNRADIDTSVPVVYPVLGYLLVRMVLYVYQPGLGEEQKPVRPLVPVKYLAVGLVLLAAGHAVANLSTQNNVLDIGYSGVVGADRLMHGEELYGNFPADDAPGQECCISTGDTYGPVNYYTYIPFELVFPWHGTFDELPAAHAAALFFDFATMLGLFLIGRRLRRGPRGRELGVMLAYAWAAFPFTWLNLTTSVNDSLVAMLLVYSFLVLHSAPARGAMLALAGFTKFAPLALGPLYLSYSRNRKTALQFVIAFAAVSFLVLLYPVLINGSPSEFWERTVDSQIGRETPFSLWGQEPGLKWMQDVVMVLAAGFAVFVAFFPRRKTPLQVAALGAAVLIALQLFVSYWFYFYIVWFLPFVLIALLADDPEPEENLLAERPARAADAEPVPA